MADNPYLHVTPRDAVTAVLLCDDALLLLTRQRNLAAFPGFCAFAGGKVDAGDEAHAPAGAPFAGHDARLLGALARELREEIGWDLAALAMSGDILSLHAAGFALTPPLAPLRFATHFYILRLRHRPALALDPREHRDAEWATPADWLRRYDDGTLLLAPPTLLALRDLAEQPQATTLPRLRRFADDAADPLIDIQPLAGLRQLLVRSNTLPPAAHTNCFLLGDGGAPRLLVDPSPADDVEYARLAQHVAGAFDAIFITHHHPDHHERADRLAREAGVPLWLSADTHRRIAARQPRFFDGLTLREVGDGDVLTRWLGREVRALAVPGHDRGQLALIAADRAWCIVGDLIQGIGTVVIAPPEGDMGEYFATLERVIALAPAVILPSHGSALGGTHYLRKALDHRRSREAQILTLQQRGCSEDDMLAEVYAGTPAALLPLARVNIRSHLDKLRRDGALT